MKKLALKEKYNHHLEFPEDTDRIVKIFADRGYEISHNDAYHSWEHFSNSRCAGWMILDKDDEVVFQDAFYYFEELK
jgi:hypothetical protein